MVLRVWNRQRQSSSPLVEGQRHHSYQASVRSGDGFGVRQAPPLTVSVLPTTGDPLTTGAVVTATGRSGLLRLRGAAAEGERDRNGHSGRPVPPPRADE